MWNDKKGRLQPNKNLPTGVPTIIYQFPEECGDYSEYKIDITDDDLNDLTKIEELQPIFDGELDSIVSPEVDNAFIEIFRNTGYDAVSDVPLKDAQGLYLFMLNSILNEIK